MKIKDMPIDSRPMDKMIKYGSEHLSNSELLAVVLKTGTKKENVVDMSSQLLNKYGLGNLSDCSLKELQEIEGIGKVKACQILALFELNKRTALAKKPIEKITCAEDVFNLYHERLKDEKQENFIVLMLNSKNCIIGEQLITKGVLDASIIHPREVFKPAIKNSASKIILVHNHPSGDPSPSQEDLDITRQIEKVGEEIGIKVLDHVIIGYAKWWGWRESKN